MALQRDFFMDADELVVDVTPVSDPLSGLMYLVYGNDADAGLAQLYTRQLEQRLRGLGALLRSSDPNACEARARLWN